MSKKKTKAMSNREMLKITKRAFLTLYRMHPLVMVSGIIRTLWGALTPYIGIYLSAQLIGELAGNRNPERLRILVLWTLISAASIGLIGSLLGRWNDAQRRKIWWANDHMFVEKGLSMDFVRVDDSETQKMLSTIQQNQNGGGWGLMKTIDQINGVIHNIFSIAGGIALSVTLFTTPVPESAGKWTILDSPVFLLAIIAAMFIIPAISAIISNKANAVFARGSTDHNLANRLFGYFCYMGQNYQMATDLRMYEGWASTSMAHALKKEGLFDSKGERAKQAKGKVGLLYTLSGAVSKLFQLLVYLYVCLKARAGAFGVGGISQYVAAVTAVATGASKFISLWGDLKNNAVFVKLIFEYLDIPNEMYQGSLSTEKRRDADYEIEFRNVSFKYPGSDTYALKDVNMKFRVGEKLALVGRNGSGKTTFIKLLCRLYDPAEGQILLNGIDIRKYDYDDYRSVFAVVFQDFKLFGYTIGQNVATAEKYDAIKARDCLVKAGFEERLNTLPDGLESYIGKARSDTGFNCSGGEAQKIAIARALYKNSPFIILDEPTAALDPVAEAEVYSNFNSIVGDRTAIYISHRLSSCRFCDEIAVFDKGTVVQKGGHEELVSDKDGIYASLWNAQAQYYE